jgi:hypothetical protein
MPKHPRDAARLDVRAAVHPAHTPILFALVTCPALVMPFGENPFEPHKAAFLWTTTAAACAAIIGSPATCRRLATALDDWRRLMVLFAGIAAIAMLVSTMLSEAPQLAWWGSALRAHGTFTALCALLLLIAILFVASPAFVGQLTSVVIIGSIGPTVYAFGQVLGVDPLKADANPLDRASSTLGNPLFFAGYLVTVWPLLLGRAILASRAVAQGGASRTITAGLWILFALQSAVLFGARARGPMLALLVATSIGGMIAIAVSGWHRLARILAGLTLVAAISFVIVAPAWMRAPSGRVTVDETVERTTGTATVRLILWEAIARGIRAHASQMVFGLGPESTTSLMSRFAGPDLRGFEGPDTAPDRAHNDTLERLASFGATGLALQMLMGGITLAAALGGLGLLPRARTRAFMIFAALVLIGSTAAAIGSGRGLWAVAIVAPAAAVIVISGWIAWLPRNHDRATEWPGWEAVPLGAATVAWLAHLIEVALSIDTVASSLTATAAVAIIVALGARAPDGTVPLASKSDRTAGEANDALAILAGWSVAVLTIALSASLRAAGFSVWAIAATTWALAVVIIGVDAGRIVRSLIAWLAVVLVWLLWRDSPGATSSFAAAVALAGRLPLFYVLAAVTMVMTALARQRHWSSAIAVSVIAGSIVGGYAIRVTSADLLMPSAARLRESDGAAAIALYREAGGRNPSNARVFTQLADALMLQAEGIPEAPLRNARFKEASDALARAAVADPFEYHHPRNLAALHRRWARASAPNDRRAHQDDADRYYRAAAELAPDSGVLIAEWANLDAERGQMNDALARLDRAASLGAEREAAAIGDAIMRAERQDISNADLLRRASIELKERGYPALAALYARRAAR